MFKSCRNLFNLSRKLGSVVGGLGLAGVLFAGQVSAGGGPRWSQSDEEHLANVVEELVEAVENGTINYWTWDTVAEQFNRITNEERTAVACLMKWRKLAKQYPQYREIYPPTAYIYWTDDDKEHLVCVVRDFVEAVRNGNINYWIWDMVATEFNRITNQERTADACRTEWSRLLKRNPRYREIHDPSARSWTDDEKACFIAAVTEHGLRSFPAISRHLRELGFNRTNKACEEYWHTVILPNHPDLNRYRLSVSDAAELGAPGRPRNIRRLRFTQEEDRALMVLVQQLGENQWETIARRLWSGRTARQYRDRYYNYLLNAVPTPFTPAEDARLMGLVQQLGENQWKTIARLFRTKRIAIHYRNRYRYLLQAGNHIPLPIPQINTPLAAPITASGNQNAVNATNTSNAATQSRQMLPLLPAPFPDININFFLNR